MKLPKRIKSIIPIWLQYLIQGVRIKRRDLCDIDPQSYISKGSRIIVSSLLENHPKEKLISIGKHCWLAEWVEIQSAFSSKIIIKDYTTIQDRCKIIGEVAIEKYCILAPDIFISSGNHYAFIHPEWLIRDQDEYILSTESGKTNHSNPVHIEEDCWLGKGVFVKPGIYIGRGAVIGSNCVITKNVPPYSIQAGIPNKEIKRRFPFDPPSTIVASQADHLPYFYRGFGHKKFEREESLQSGVLFSEKQSVCVVKKMDYKSLLIEGIVWKKNIGDVSLRIRISGYNEIVTQITNDDFKLNLDLIKGYNSINPFLEAQFTIIQFDISGNFKSNKEYHWGLAKVGLQT